MAYAYNILPRVFAQVLVSYKRESRLYKVHTPSRRTVIKRMARKNFHTSASALVQSPRQLQSIIPKLAIKIRGEMKRASSRDHDSILRDSVEAIKHFHWETVRLELVQQLPTLMSLLAHLVGRPSERSPLLCLLASIILKCRHQPMALVQRAISVMLYGHGTAKQVS